MVSVAKKILNSKLLRRYTGVMPDFLIIGAQKCGTSSLYKYLTKHPFVEPAQDFFKSSKEVRFFSKHYHKGIFWYRRHFPSFLYKNYFKKIYGQNFITGEATPSYIFHPLAPRLICKHLPNVKLIALLRNPIDRAYSHHQHAVRIGKESLSFEEAIDAEHERLEGEKEKMLLDANYRSFEYMYHSYLTRGIYSDQIEVLFRLFPNKQILILCFESLFSNLRAHFQQVLEFLNLEPWTLKEDRKHNVGRYSQMKPATRKKLIEFYKPHNDRLFKLIGEEYQWD